MDKSKIVDHRVDFYLIMSASKCLPQGDPDGDNSPRMDSSGRGFITPQGIKRKVRDFREYMGDHIHVTRGGVLETNIREAVDKAGLDASSKILKFDPKDKLAVIKKLCEIFWDVKTFGGVLTTLNEHLTGPVQLGFACSVEPIQILDVGIGRVCIQREKDQDIKDRDLGRMSIVDFGVYTQPGSVSPAQAQATGFTWGDYEKFVEACLHMFDHSKSTTRADMVLERLYEFHHPSELGVVGSHKLYRAVKVVRKNPSGGELAPPSSIEDYEISLDRNSFPKSIEVKIHE